MTLQCRELEPALAERVQAWTFPAYRHLLDMRPTVRIDGPDRRPIRPFGFVAFEGGEPKGLVLGCLPDGAGTSEAPNDPELLSVYVAPEARQRGIGRQLVGELEDAVGAEGFDRAITVYMTGPREIEFVERILERRLWKAPEARMLVLKGTIQQLQAAPWHGKYQLDSRFQFFSWQDLPPEDLARLKESQRAEPWIPEDLVPWSHGAADASSVGVRFEGEVVGWVINHRLSETTLRFTCSFIRRDLSRRGRIVPAYSESIRRAAEAGFRRATFTVPLRHAEMAAFALRRCAPYLSFQGETRGSSKELSAQGERQ